MKMNFQVPLKTRTNKKQKSIHNITSQSALEAFCCILESYVILGILYNILLCTTLFGSKIWHFFLLCSSLFFFWKTLWNPFPFISILFWMITQPSNSTTTKQLWDWGWGYKKWVKLIKKNMAEISYLFGIQWQIVNLNLKFINIVFITFLTACILPDQSKCNNSRITLYRFNSDVLVLILNRLNKKVSSLMGAIFWNGLICRKND